MTKKYERDASQTARNDGSQVSVKEAANRYRTGHSLAQDLDRVLGDPRRSVSAPKSDTPERKRA